jgi:hypothetical protein
MQQIGGVMRFSQKWMGVTLDYRGTTAWLCGRISASQARENQPYRLCADQSGRLKAFTKCALAQLRPMFTFVPSCGTIRHLRRSSMELLSRWEKVESLPMVLIVEDYELIQGIVQDALKEGGFETLSRHRLKKR